MILLVVACAGVVVWFPASAYWYLQGGWDGVRAPFVVAPREDDPSMQSRRAATREQLANDLAQALPAGDFASGESIDDESCYEGQNNYKVHSGYVWRCSIWGARFYAFDGDPVSQVSPVEARLSGQGWTTDETLAEESARWRRWGEPKALPSATYERAEWTQHLDLDFVQAGGRLDPGVVLRWPQAEPGIRRLLADHDYVLIIQFGWVYYDD